MAMKAQTAKPFNLRLPAWAVEFVEAEASETRTTKTQVVIDAIACLRAERIRALMREGYEEMREVGQQLAEADLVAGNESMPEW